MENFNLDYQTVEIREQEYMSDLYPNGLPNNAIIDKTLTAKGATTSELEAKRNSIIIEPNVPVINGKQAKYPKALGVREGITDANVKAYLQDKSIRYKKIIVTPESYSKVVRAAGYADINLFKDFFLLIDECEKTIQDADFRPDIILPFFDFFSFENKALISATPLFPNLKGFTNHSFSHIKIIPQYDYKKNLNLVGTNNVQQEFLNQISQSGNKKAIFLNSIDYAKALIEKANIRNCSKIYCSNQNDTISKLNEEGYNASDNFMSGEVLEEYNFFTSRFYSAVDLETPDKPDIIMITDCLSRAQTMIDPFTHAVQIVGRFRKGIVNITHITNWNSDLKPQSRESIIEDMKAEEAVYIKIVALKETLTGKQRELLKEIEERTPVYRFLFEDGSYKGKINPFLLECYIQKFKIASFYQHLQSLENAYCATGHFNVAYHYEHYDEKPQTVKGKTLSRKRKLEILERLQVLEPKGLVLVFFTDEQQEELASLKHEAPELCKYYEKFGVDRIVEIDYNLTTMKRQLKAEHKKEIYFIPIDEIHNSFEIGKPYSESEIIMTLQMIYDKYKLIDDNNNPLKSKATNLGYYFNISDRMTIPSTRLKGYIPLSKKYSLE
ncbi:MAG: hypothetical protein KHY35_02160 [Bacteroides thetaiotaomicron]|uniref:Uncharacterized protein n=1 Tax=Bacteroides thetaiotaomicron TaxID=818 RepID=A0A943HQ67_BACT4|nr:hypothetical protein [Bacteroides thetaiotaomicron]